MFPLYLKFKGELDGMICIAANEELATALLADLQAELEYNPRILNDFGEQKALGNWEEGFFATKDGIAFRSYGKKQSPRGVRYRNRRPNYATVDDYNTDISLKNDAISEADFYHITEAVLPAIMDSGKWWLIIPQNKFHKNCVTTKFEESDIDCYVSTVNLIDENGESTWHQKTTTEQAQEMIDSVGFFSAEREYKNNPVQEGKIFKEVWLYKVKRLPFNHYDHVVAYYDPSYTNSMKSDYKAVVLIGKKGSNYHILKCFVERVSIPKMWAWGYALDEFVGDNSLIRHYMEANFIQGMHFEKLDEYEKQHGRRLRVKGDTRKKPDKYQRIESMQPLFEFGKVKISQTEYDNPHMKRLRDQLLAFEKGTRVNDDAPDALEGAICIVDTLTKQNKPIHFIPNQRRYSGNRRRR